MWKRIKENAPAAAALGTLFIAFVAVAQLSIVNPIQQRFDTIDQRFEDFRAVMNQRFDVVDQRFDAVDQRFDDQLRYINQRFDDQNGYINQRFDNQLRYINQRFDDQNAYINQRFDAVEERLGVLSEEVSDVRRLADRVSRNEGRLDAITQQLQAIETPAP